MINFPVRLDFENSIAFAHKLRELPAQEEYHFDAQRLQWVEPFGMLLISNEIKRQVRERQPSKFFVHRVDLDRNAHGYAGHMGFWKAFGLNVGNLPGQAAGNNRYLPITYMEFIELRKQAVEQGIIHIGQAIDDRARQLAQVLTRQYDGPVVDVVNYSLREMMQNVIEHSEAPAIGYCAQYWPRTATVELDILDQGVGLRRTLSANPYVEVNDDYQAINAALIPGISGKFFKGVPVENDNPWQNSGFGLYMIDRFCSNGGSFFICSGAKGLLNQSGGSKTYFDTDYEGTILRLVMKTDQIHNLRELLEQFSQEGQIVARQYIGEQRLSASLASRMIRDDFKLPEFKVGDRIHHPQYGIGTVLDCITEHKESLLRVRFDGGRTTKVHPIKGRVIKLDIT